MLLRDLEPGEFKDSCLCDRSDAKQDEESSLRFVALYSVFHIWRGLDGPSPLCRFLLGAFQSVRRTAGRSITSP